MTVLALVALVAGSASSQQSIVFENVVYEAEGMKFEGYRARPGHDRKVPLIFVVHDWNGIDDYEQGRARQLAELGYAAFAIDVYGQGVRPKPGPEASAEASKYYRDNALFRKRLTAGFEAGLKSADIYPNRVGVMGYCFGGAAALEMARMGTAAKGFVSFHGGLKTSKPAEPNIIKGRILVLHGSDDPFVPKADVEAFTLEMNKVKADWKMISYPDAVHAFTEPSAGSNKASGAAYNEAADKQSWLDMQAFWRELFLNR